MSVLTLLFRRDIPRSVWFQVWLNIACSIYMWTITLAVTHLTFFYIIPECHDGDELSIFKHRLFIWYIFTSVVGNYVTCIATETKVKRMSNVKVKHPPESQPTVKQVGMTTQTVKRKKTASSVNNINGKYCITCDIHVPVRAHHCYLCEKCVIKRDHHCFFMTVCIGKNNHLYFILFTLYMGIGTFYGLLHIAKYLHFLYGIQFHGPQTFLSLFLSTISALLGGKLPPFMYLSCFVFLYISLAGTLFAFGFFAWHMLITSRGQTTYEARNGIHKFSRGSILLNLKQVFNNNWIVSALVPFWDLVMNAK